jgi:ankyrin repeat protein
MTQPSAWRVEDGHVEVVRALLQHEKVDVNLQNADCRTALFLAS